ncbi:hypothetical protein, partial [Paenibacillus graminis]
QPLAPMPPGAAPAARRISMCESTGMDDPLMQRGFSPVWHEFNRFLPLMWVYPHYAAGWTAL